MRARVAAVAGAATVTLGTLADSVDQAGAALAAAFRDRHPCVRVAVREADFSDPTAGLRAGLVDVALTRAPFDGDGIATHVLGSYPVGFVLRADDPLADRDRVSLADIADRPWFRFPDGTDPAWQAFWACTSEPGRRRPGPAVRTVHQCLQSVLWSGSVGLAPLGHALPAGLTVGSAGRRAAEPVGHRLAGRAPRPARTLLRPHRRRLLPGPRAPHAARRLRRGATRLT